jgi:electron transport complex protein RnfB
MSDDLYKRLADVLNTLPSGFPATEDGLEIKILKKVFKPDQAELFCDLRLEYETPEQIAQRTGRPLDGLEKTLIGMWDDGQVMGIDFGTVKVFKMLPWVFGIFEFQNSRLDKELAEMTEKYMRIFSPQFFKNKPQLMQVIPVEREIEAHQEALPYEKVSSIIEGGQSFAIADCICKKEKGLLGHPCDRPMEVCLAVAPVPGVFDSGRHGRPITKQEAYDILNMAEEQGLVHLTWNAEDERFFICNCCSCCCNVLLAINELGILGSVNSYYVAEIDPDQCTACGLCADERCQVRAIEEGDDGYQVIPERCIGCGLCVSACPGEAIRLVRKSPDQIALPPKNQTEWFEARGMARGVDFSQFK